MVTAVLGLARAVLAIADVEQNRVGRVIYTYHGNYQLWLNRHRNDKNSGGLFQFKLRQRSRIGPTFYDSLDGFNYQKHHRISADNRRNNYDFHARTRRSDDSFGLDNDGYSGQASV